MINGMANDNNAAHMCHTIVCCPSVSVSVSALLPMLPYHSLTYPSSTPTVCDPLNFVCCLWRKKMRLSILATCKNFISCAGDVAVQCIDPHSLTHTHTHTLVTCYTTAEPPYPFPTPPPLIPWLVAVFAKRLFALRLPVLFRIRFTDNCITALNISLFAATASHAPFSSSSRLLAAFVRLAAEALVSHTL